MGLLIPLCQSQEYMPIAELQTQIAALGAQVQQPSVHQKPNINDNDDDTTTANMTTLDELMAQLARDSEAQRKIKIFSTRFASSICM